MTARSTTDDAKTDDTKTADKSGENKSKSGSAYLNATTGPLVYDRDGHQVDAAAWTPEITLDAVGKAARGAGYLKLRSEL